jgi:H+/Cl- antiporter ClcA
MLDKLADKFSPKVAALLALPVLLVLSMPFAFISGAFSIIVTDNVAVGWTVGIIVAAIFGLWASFGMYRLSSEVQEEKGQEDVALNL